MILKLAKRYSYPSNFKDKSSYLGSLPSRLISLIIWSFKIILIRSRMFLYPSRWTSCKSWPFSRTSTWDHCVRKPSKPSNTIASRSFSKSTCRFMEGLRRSKTRRQSRACSINWMSSRHFCSSAATFVITWSIRNSFSSKYSPSSWSRLSRGCGCTKRNTRESLIKICLKFRILPSVISRWLPSRRTPPRSCQETSPRFSTP